MDRTTPLKDEVGVPLPLRFQEDALFDEWRRRIARRGEAAPFVPDGVACEDSWNEQETRLLFALKEANADEAFDLRDYVASGANPRTWNNVVRWFEATREPDAPPPSWGELVNVDEARREAVLPNVVAMNVKKTAGGAQANDPAISAAADADADLILRQIGLYAPGPDLVVVCCGTYPWLAAILGGGEDRLSTSRGIRYGAMPTGGRSPRVLAPAVPVPG